MADSGDRNGILVCVIEEHTIIAAAQPKAGGGWLELLHVSCTIGEEPIQAMKNLLRGFAVDGAQVCAC